MKTTALWTGFSLLLGLSACGSPYRLPAPAEGHPANPQARSLPAIALGLAEFEPFKAGDVEPPQNKGQKPPGHDMSKHSGHHMHGAMQ